jgi:hypothetical protein
VSFCNSGQEALSKDYLSTIFIFEDVGNNGTSSKKVADRAKRTIMEATKFFSAGVFRLGIDDPVSEDYGIRKTPSVLLCVNNGTNCRLLEGKLLRPEETLEQLYSFTEEMGMPIQMYQVRSMHSQVSRIFGYYTLNMTCFLTRIFLHAFLFAVEVWEVGADDRSDG